MKISSHILFQVAFQGTTTQTLHSDGSSTLQTDLKLDYDIPKTELNKSKSYAIELPQDTTWTNINENQEYTGKEGDEMPISIVLLKKMGRNILSLAFWTPMLPLLVIKFMVI